MNYVVAHVDNLAALAAILGVSGGVATEATLAAINAKVTACNTGAVVVSASTLPTGAATSALQTSGNSSLTTIAAKDIAKESGGNLATLAGKDFATQTTLALIKDTDGIKKITDPISISVLKPDGTNIMPSMDDSTRPGWIKQAELVPTATGKINGSLALGYTGTDLTTIQKTIGGVTYTKTLTYVAGTLTAVSAWS